MTTNIWTSRANHGYIGVTIHYINDNFELPHHLLQTQEFPQSHTVVNIKSELLGILEEWKIDETKISGITTDNGKNIAAAI